MGIGTSKAERRLRSKGCQPCALLSFKFYHFTPKSAAAPRRKEEP